MVAAIKLRNDYTEASLQKVLRAVDDPEQRKRLSALCAIYAGSTNSKAAEQVGVTPQVIRDWILRFNESGPDGLKTHKPTGRKPKLNEFKLVELSTIIRERLLNGSNNRVVRKQVVGLVSDEFGILLNETTIGRIIRDKIDLKMG
jgi:transposase